MFFVCLFIIFYLFKKFFKLTFSQSNEDASVSYRKSFPIISNKEYASRRDETTKKEVESIMKLAELKKMMKKGGKKKEFQITESDEEFLEIFNLEEEADKVEAEVDLKGKEVNEDED